jgi:hypothetical protein
MLGYDKMRLLRRWSIRGPATKFVEIVPFVVENDYGSDPEESSTGSRILLGVVK